MYRAIIEWRDLEDNHLYHRGDAYPHDGRKISEDRIAELSGTQNKAGFALIEPLAVPAEEIPVQKEEPAKKPKRTRKTTG